MTVEFVEYIGDFKPYLPNSYDYIKEGDDHIRNIKKGLKGTFPNFDSALNYSSTELNIMAEYLGASSTGLIWKQNVTVERDKILKVQPNGVIISEDELPPVGTIVPVIDFEGQNEFESLYGNWFVLCDGTTTITDEAINKITGQTIFTVPNLSDGRYLRMAPTEEKINERLDAKVDVSGWTMGTPVATNVATTDGGVSHDHNQGSGVWTGSAHRINWIYETNTEPWHTIYNNNSTDNRYYHYCLTRDGGSMGSWAYGYGPVVSSGGGAPNAHRPGSYQVGTMDNAAHAHVINAPVDTKYYATITISPAGTETRPKSYSVVYYIRTN